MAFDELNAKITSEEEARSFIKYAGAAYCNKRSLLNWNCDNCNGYTTGSSETVYFSKQKTSAAGYLTVNKNKKLIVLSYRGTKDIVNWLYNLDFSFVSADLDWPYNNAGIHSGFDATTKSLLSNSTDAIQNALGKYPTFKVVFTGHSLGGALAALTAFRLAQNGVIPWEKINLITYGQPRLGTPEFADFLNAQAWTSTRVTSYGDLIAISYGRSLGYAHNQHNMHINKYGQTIQCSTYKEDKNCIGYIGDFSREAHFTYWDQRIKTKC
ncbi:alpha/beta-hydrolase [Conidiobolus coronatus NRRL 28638]|uniref:Alpha/beta-hydrolase n=1 Tax=Conidiobolus coronatus (strain ATCC 28846 / CBS 209.66 / NRRL 28638) TaxID=796925 RepID=A0A137NS55_CONC2|nr:alpha/beta-hydrolase [Conidiobolus coronatus NRRL 28638]|eukprot:KXN65591.1 alpha/beta-hydrolase [Conidiobolus coronatus NRRL 28638]